MLGDFPKALDDAMMDSGAAHQNQMKQRLFDPDPARARMLSKVFFDSLTGAPGHQ
jgi:type I restriction enzyme, R subunit